MAEVLLFHHAQGLTPGVRAFADELRAAGHTVHTPDLFEGRTFDSIDDGMAFIRGSGMDEMVERGEQAAHDLPNELVYAGFSFGEMVAQKLRPDTAGRPGSAALLLVYPDQRRVGRSGPGQRASPSQIHGMDADPYFVGEGDVEAAREIVEQVDDAELFLYPGDQHYFADSSLPLVRRGRPTALLTRRVLDFLDRV